ncbi:unnamed protein product [Dibothriocephalus latus]|uniref:Uncharacterized protein n=1 Tax=Dibothriocephalus latus TaxID=60516 RepID=A0A3P7N7I6_DIBLA|nr:unnamed protein product [Dibothriocephalus latus]
MRNKQILRKLVRTGRQKLASLEEHEPGKLLNRHLLCRSLNKWISMHKKPRKSSWIDEREEEDKNSFSWDDESDFQTVGSLTEVPQYPPCNGLSPLETLALAAEYLYPLGQNQSGSQLAVS